MATLQTIRSKGPLLVVVIGLALFAFIAGDAWKVLQPHQGKQDVGEMEKHSPHKSIRKWLMNTQKLLSSLKA